MRAREEEEVRVEVEAGRTRRRDKSEAATMGEISGERRENKGLMEVRRERRVGREQEGG